MEKENLPYPPEQVEVDPATLEAIEKCCMLLRNTEYFDPADAEFYDDDNFDNLAGALYGTLLDMGEDPDEIFAKYKIMWPLEDAENALSWGGVE